MPAWTQSRLFRSWLLPSLYLFLAFGLAVLGLQAQFTGQSVLGLVLLLMALLLALVTLTPRLYRRLRTDYLSGIRFFRFTRRGSVFLLTVLGIAFASLNTGNNLLILVLSVLLSSMIVSGMVANGMLGGVKISLNLPNNIHAGHPVIFYLAFFNLKKRLPSMAMLLKGAFESASSQARLELSPIPFPFVAAGHRVRRRIECRFPARGVYTVSGFHVLTSFPFGFFARGRTLDVSGQIAVFPTLVNLDLLWLRFPHLRDGKVETLRKGTGNSLYNIRPYRSGDRARFVHWKSTAKLGRLMVKDFLREEDQPIHLVFSTYLPESDERRLLNFEEGISWVASLAAYYFSCHRVFAFTSEDYQVLVKGRQRDYEALMQYLAQVRPSRRRRVPTVEAGTPVILFSAGDAVSMEGAYAIDYLKLPQIRRQAS